MDIVQLRELINKMEALPCAELPEATLFSIGGKGYYENPTTEILAFFCDSNGAHGLDNLVINALFRALPESFDLKDLTLITKPETEVRTSKAKRIELLLEGDDWVMVIENKIYHQQVYPFDIYENHIKSDDSLKSKQHIFVVLSPNGKAPEGWLPLSYTGLLECLKDELAQTFIEQPLNKWLVLLREFILHLEGIMAKPVTPNETVDFVLDHLNEIKKVQDLKQQAITAFQQDVLLFIQSAVPGKSVSSKVVHWHGYPAIRFYFNDWGTASDAVLFLDGRIGKAFSINYYACDIGDQEQRKQAEKHFIEDDCGKPWDEKNKTIRCYKARFKTTEKDEMKALLVHKLKLLDGFETKVRPAWNKA